MPPVVQSPRIRDSYSLIMRMPMIEITTARLKLIPCSAEVTQAALDDRASLEKRLGARLPADWPAHDLRDFLPVYAKLVDTEAMLHGWGIWLILLPAERS